ncbi:radical SAM/SPASM domain-containing protein [Tepidibacter mesophilus]|uniref:radical SAM/SPASM domain-containing protein n=1 Tax=Tepidibacter mesophilus TaxID=655607 RepID=UPI000C0715C8|nr:SPASM domain-containing protein [Tepidibacter mesophilus]
MFKLSLELTNSCNMECKYCYLPHEEQFMNIEIAKKSICMAISECKKQKFDSLSISYLGGEPLLCKTRIKFITEYAEDICQKENISIYFNITTNGTFIDKDTICFFIKHNFSIRTSLDGCIIDNDKNRIMKNGSSAYNSLKHNLDLFKFYEEKSNKQVQLSMVINKNTYKNLYENFKHITELGFKYIATCLETYSKWNMDELEEIELQFKKIALYCIEKASKDEFVFWNIPYHGFNILNKKYKHFYCYAGKVSMYVKADGSIYSCSACQKEEFKIGSTQQGFNEDRRKQFIDYKRDISEKCKKCEYLDRCINLDCIALKYELTGDKTQVPFHYCQLTKIQSRLVNYINEKKCLV